MIAYQPGEGQKTEPVSSSAARQLDHHRAAQLANEIQYLSRLMKDPDPRCPINHTIPIAVCEGCRTGQPLHALSVTLYHQELRRQRAENQRELDDICRILKTRHV